MILTFKKQKVKYIEQFLLLQSGYLAFIIRLNVESLYINKEKFYFEKSRNVKKEKNHGARIAGDKSRRRSVYFSVFIQLFADDGRGFRFQRRRRFAERDERYVRRGVDF